MELTQTKIRIGNLITDVHSINNKPWPIAKFTSKTVSYGYTHPYYKSSWENVRGVDIKHEHLISMGFTYSKDYNGYWYYTKIWLKDIYKGFLNPNGHFCMLFYDRRSLNIKYLHQLQNQFFGITGEELEIKF